MTPLQLWITIGAMGLVTYLTRLSFIMAWGRLAMPDLVRRALRYVPTAVLSAIILPELLRPGGGALNVSLSNARLIAGLAAALLAWRTRNVLLTITIGMAVLWGLGLIGV
ncbi:MAG TPA: AzlD domain-containing protein [Anaerolineales bacterium]|nr:AzlD domain-containing protein [Anaerolineales bacterium]